MTSTRFAKCSIRVHLKMPCSVCKILGITAVLIRLAGNHLLTELDDLVVIMGFNRMSILAVILIGLLCNS